MTDKEEHLDIREKLQNMPSVKASDDFIMKLQKRINLAEAQPSTQIHKQHQEKLEGGFFAKLFGGRNAWLVPAMGVTAVVFLVFIWVYVVNQNGITTSDNEQTPTISQKEEQKQNSGIGDMTGSKEEENNVGETLKTKLPGTEIANTFGYTDSRNQLGLDKGDREGGYVPSDEETVVSSKPEVNVSPTSEEIESPSPSMEVRGLKTKETEKKKEEKSSIKTGVLKQESAPPPAKNNQDKDSLGNFSDDKIKSAEEKRVSRNVIDQTELENLREKVQEKTKE